MGTWLCKGSKGEEGRKKAKQKEWLSLYS
jgi:hypothetical protein